MEATLAVLGQHRRSANELMGKRTTTRRIFLFTTLIACFCAGWFGKQRFDDVQTRARYERFESVLDGSNGPDDLPRVIPHRIGTVFETTDQEFETSLGFDDGMRVGDNLIVSRNEVTLGSARIVSVDVNSSSCTSIGFIPKLGDRVETKP